MNGKTLSTEEQLAIDLSENLSENPPEPPAAPKPKPGRPAKVTLDRVEAAMLSLKARHIKASLKAIHLELKHEGSLSTISALRNKVLAKQIDIDGQFDDQSAEKAMMDTVRSVVASLRDEVAQAADKAVERGHEDADRRIALAEKRFADLRVDKRGVEKELETRLDQQQHLKDEAKLLHKEKAALNKQLDDLREAQNNTLKSSSSQGSQLSTLRESLSESQSEKRLLEHALSQAQSEVLDRNNTINEQSEAIQSAQQQLSDLRLAIDEHESIVQERDRTIYKFTTQILHVTENKKQLISAHEREITSLQKQLDSQTQALAEFRQMLVSLEQQATNAPKRKKTKSKKKPAIKR